MGDSLPRAYLELLTDDELKKLRERAEELWERLQANDLGGYSGCNRALWIAVQFRYVIEEFGHRDTGLRWSKDDLDAWEANNAGR